MTIDEVGAAIDLKDPAVIEAAENGRVALSFELIQPFSCAHPSLV